MYSEQEMNICSGYFLPQQNLAYSDWYNAPDGIYILVSLFSLNQSQSFKKTKGNYATD